MSRLDELARQIRALRVLLIETERAAFDLLDGEDEDAHQRRLERATSTRALLNAALVEHFDLAQAALRPRASTRQSAPSPIS